MSEKITREIDVQGLIDMNYRALTLLGIATSLIMQAKSKSPKSEFYKYDWFLQAVNDVVYLHQPLPPFPDTQLL